MRGMGYCCNAGTSFSCAHRVNPFYLKQNKVRPVTHCKTIAEIAGFDGSSIQRDTFWLTVHETPAVVVQDLGVFPDGKSFLHDLGHAVMVRDLGYVENKPGSYPKGLMLLCKLVHQILLWSQGKLLSLSLNLWVPESRSRRPGGRG